MGLDSVEWLMEIEEEFGVDLPDPVAESLRTVGDAVDAVVARVHAEQWPRDRVELRAREITARLFSKDLDEVRLDTRRIEDLEAD